MKENQLAFYDTSRDSCFLSLPWPLCCHIAEIVLGQNVAIQWVLVSSPQLNEQKLQEGLSLEKSFPLCTRFFSFRIFQTFSSLFPHLYVSLTASPQPPASKPLHEPSAHRAVSIVVSSTSGREV